MTLLLLLAIVAMAAHPLLLIVEAVREWRRR